jgi:hypothetical protein
MAGNGLRIGSDKAAECHTSVKAIMAMLGRDKEV